MILFLRNFFQESVAFLFLVISAVGMRIWGSQISLDAKFYYTSAEAKVFFEGLSSEEVQSYLRNELLDLCFLSGYTVFFFLLAQRLFSKTSRLKWLVLVPGSLDLIETLTIVCILQKFYFNQVPVWLGFVTCGKWSTGLGITLFCIQRKFFASKLSIEKPSAGPRP